MQVRGVGDLNTRSSIERSTRYSEIWRPGSPKVLACSKAVRTTRRSPHVARYSTTKGNDFLLESR